MNWLSDRARYLQQIPYLNKVWRIASQIKKKLFVHSPKSQNECLYDLVLEGESPHDAKKALFSYIVHPFEMSEDDPRFLSHINIWRAREMVRVLNQMGYVVDVIDYRDTDFVPHRSYDLFIGHGGINFETIAHQLPGETVKIYFSTGCYWRFHNEQELARFEALRERRDVTLPPDRLIQHSEEGALQAADGVIGMGNDFTKETYKDFSPVIMINDTALEDDHYERTDKDFIAGKNHFLYFAGGGNVHKGLDFLLEAFSELGQHLWICSRTDKEFADVYSNELYERENIHLIGWIQLRSDEFYKVMQACNYAILPSCSEGGAHSIVECMNQGLITIVSRACGLDVADYGFYIEPCTITEIKRLVKQTSHLSGDDYREMSLAARKAAINEFSESAFSNNLQEAIDLIIRSKGE